MGLVGWICGRGSMALLALSDFCYSIDLTSIDSLMF